MTDEGAELGEVVADLRAKVDELHRAEDELAQQNDELLFLHRALDAETHRYHLLFDTAPVAYLATDRWGKILDANVAATELLGVPNRFLVGKPIVAFVDPLQRREFRAWMLELIRRSRRGDVSVRMRRRSGVAFEAAARAVAVASEIGWTLRDMTEERQAEGQLWELNRELEERIAQQAGELQAVYDQLPVGVAIVDAPTRRLRTANRMAQQLLGEALDGAEGSPITLQLLRAAEQQISRSLAGEAVRSELVRLTPPRGEEVVYEISASPLRDDHHAVKAAVLTFHDVTARERREQADREFVANAAHQIRTPITALMTTVAALQAGAKDDPVERDRFLVHLARESDRLARLAEALLALARVTRGDTANADLGVVPLRAMLEDLVAAAPVAVTLDCPGDTAALSNGPLLEQCLQNALDNAVKHGAPPISISARLEGETAVVEVHDSGPGMVDDDRRRVLERFYRGSGEQDGAGFGLGLAIAAAAARAAAATLELDGTNGTGTTVRLTVQGARLRPSA